MLQRSKHWSLWASIEAFFCDMCVSTKLALISFSVLQLVSHVSGTEQFLGKDLYSHDLIACENGVLVDLVFRIRFFFLEKRLQFCPRDE